MAAYTAAWNAEDINAIEAFYHVPSISYGGEGDPAGTHRQGELHTWGDALTGREVDRGWIEVNRREGPATWVRLVSDITLMGQDSAQVTTRWVYRRPDGTDVWDFVDTHLLGRFGNEWQLFCRILHR